MHRWHDFLEWLLPWYQADEERKRDQRTTRSLTKAERVVERMSLARVRRGYDEMGRRLER